MTSLETLIEFRTKGSLFKTTLLLWEVYFHGKRYFKVEVIKNYWLCETKDFEFFDSKAEAYKYMAKFIGI